MSCSIRSMAKAASISTSPIIAGIVTGIHFVIKSDISVGFVSRAYISLIMLSSSASASAMSILMPSTIRAFSHLQYNVSTIVGA